MAKDSFKFSFKDWSNDVKYLSLSARGLLIELIIELRKKGGRIELDEKKIARFSGGSEEEVRSALEEIYNYAILDREVDRIEDKTFIKSRRILREFEKSRINKENGAMGGNPKLSNRKTFTVPSIEEVKKFFFDNGFPESLGDRAFKYYDDAAWKDSRDKPVKNWKQKMRGVWFKEENRIAEDPKTTKAPPKNGSFK
jgi:hypothetical protein